MLWLCLGLPFLPLEVFTRAACTPNSTAPFVVSEGAGRAQSVLMMNDTAWRGGIRLGMPLAAAHALVSPLQVRTRDTIAERAALERLAAWAGKFTSHVSITSARTLLLEIQGSLRLFRGLAPLCEALRRDVTALGYRAALAVAPTPLAASWLVRAGDEIPVTDMRALAGRLFELPLDCLDLATEQYTVLQGIGLRTVGECLRLPRDGLARRLGAEFVTALDRAFGRLPDPRKFYVAPLRFEARLALPGAVDNAESVLFPLNRLLLELGGFLTVRVAGVQELELQLLHTKASATPIELGLVRATRDTKRLTELFRERLERVVLAEPVEEIVLRAPRLLPLAASDADFFAARHQRPEAAAELIERLSARLGREAVRGVSTVAEHRPECAWHYIEPGAAASAEAPTERPLWLLREPVALEVRDDRPYLDGVLELEPDVERIESGWWDGNDVRRDYFVAHDTAGARLWVYRELSGDRSWWLQGVFG